MRSVVNCAVLNLVAQKASYGGEIAARFDSTYAGLLRPRRTHIYRSLRALKEQGFIEPYRTTRGSNRQPLIHYRVTDAGRDELRAWLTSPLRPGAVEQEMAVRLLSVQEGDRDTLRGLLDVYQGATLAAGASLDFEDGEDEGTGAWFRELERVEVDASLQWLRWARRQVA